MRTTVARLLVSVSVLGLAACGPSGETVIVRPPLKGQAPELVKGLPASLGSEQTLSAEFLDKPADGTPSTPKPTGD